MTEWIEKMKYNNPDAHYMLRVTALFEIMEYADEAGLADAIIAAYHHGFQRGRNYERNKRKAKERG